ncbi:MAG: hypothetical protein IJ106_08180 [Parasporobacterium sp.]|nr:hypothetical protein [Parasporobacterium sp.]
MKNNLNPIQNYMVPEDTPFHHIPDEIPEQDEIEAIEAFTLDDRITCSLDEINWQ